MIIVNNERKEIKLTVDYFTLTTTGKIIIKHGFYYIIQPIHKKWLQHLIIKIPYYKVNRITIKR